MSTMWLQTLLVCITPGELDSLLESLGQASTAGFDVLNPAAAARAMAAHSASVHGIEFTGKAIDDLERVIYLCNLVAAEYARARSQGLN